MDEMKIISTGKCLCLSCMEVHDVHTVKMMESMIFKGVEFEYEATHYYCRRTDELFSDESMMTENYNSMQQAYKEIKKK